MLFTTQGGTGTLYARRFAVVAFLVLASGLLAAPGQAQNQLSITPSVLDAPGNVATSGTSFRYRISYSCDLVSLPSCDNAVVTITLPSELEFVDRFFPPDVASGVHDGSPTGGVVTFTFQPTVAAGNTGDLEVVVRFVNGSTPDGTTTTGTLDAVISTGDSLVTVMTDLPPVTSDASPQESIGNDLQGGFLGDCPTPSTYQLTIGPSSAPGSLDWLDADVVLELPLGVTGVTPSAGGVFDAMANTVTWTGLGPLSVGGPAAVLTVGVSFLDPPFSAGQNVTSRVTVTADPLDEPPDFVFGPTTFDDTLVQFSEDPDASVNKRFGGGRPTSLPPAEGQDFSYRVQIRNTGNIDLDTLVVTDDGDGIGGAIDPAITVSEVGTGAYSPAPTSVTLNLLGDMGTMLTVTSVDGSTNTTLTTAGLMPGERVDRIEWVFNGGAPVGMGPTTEALVSATVDVGFPAGTFVSNHADLDWTATLTGLCGGVAGPTAGGDSDNFDFTVADPYAYLRSNKRENTSGDYFPGDTVGFRLDVTNDVLSDASASGIVVTDLLPEFLTFDMGSEVFTDNGTGVSVAMFDILDNYNATGRTLLRWTLMGDLDPDETVRIDFTTTVELGVIFGTLTNTMGASFTGPPDQICASASRTDVADLDGDGDFADTLCSDDEGIVIAAAAQLQSRKFVRGQCDTVFTPGLGTGVTTLGGAIDWRVTVQNVLTVPMEDVVIVDILPFVGDTGVRDTTLRDTAFRPLLIQPITPPPGGAVFYSTSGNPCRGEVGGPTSGCDAPNWSTVPPSPITDVQSVKIEFGDLILNPLDELEFEWRMIAPADAPIAIDPINPISGEIAWNSFAFGARRTDDGGFLGAEPNKVGVAVKPPVPANLGDRVWSDDDGDGTQNEPIATSGINDVPVQLFDPGPDGLPRTGDDVLVLSSITADDASGDPGWYQFSLLDPGDYFVCFQPPPNRPVTTMDAGGDDALDSDVDPLTLCTPVVTLGPGDDDQTLDLGLVPGVSASLGNYVWFDRNGDGVQNEPPTSGVNGVTVRLFADDGDGNPEPGGQDGSPLEITVTADDAFGNPGFYGFDELIPGVPYFVQFILPPTADDFTSRNAGGNDVVDSDARSSDGTSQVVTLAPGEDNPTLDAGLDPRDGVLALGNVVWCDDDGNGVIDAATDDDGVYDPLLPEDGVNGVRVDLYLDDNGDGIPQADEFFGATLTSTSAGKTGRYRFADLPPADYLVVVPASNFDPGAPLEGKVPSSAAVTDPDDDVDSDSEGETLGPLVVSRAITLATNSEPIPDADDDLGDDDSSNFTLDFGFVPGAPVAFDYGDAPDAGNGSAQGDYETTVLDDGASHLLAGFGPFLGLCVDSDSGLQQDALARDDDTTGADSVTFGPCVVVGDDEDGVAFSSTMLPMGGTVDVTLTNGSGVGCLVNGWVDWNRDGAWDVGEQIATDVLVTAAPVPLLGIPVPATAEPGITYARFRCSTAGGDGPTGPAADGEVEDYLLEILGADFGDAPDVPYGTLMASGGPFHGTDPSVELYLGTCVDTEIDGQPGVGATGDDLGLGTSRIGDCVDDENGVTFDSMLVRGEMASITVVASMPGRIDGWIDFDGVGGFAGADQILVDVPLVAGANAFAFPVPPAAVLGTTYARFRFSTAGGLPPGGPAADGEVEDYAVLVKGHDLGDAPDTYGTSLGAGGPRHVVDPTSSLRLGACEDAELDAALPLDGTGDDVSVGTGTAGACAVGGDDEDGVVFTSMVIACQTAAVTVTAGQSGRLDAWVDFDRDGTFAGVGEKVFDNRGVSAGANALTFPVPCTADLGASYTRWRLSSSGGLGIGGTVMDGEVEDHAVLIKGVDFGDAPDSHATTFSSNGPNHGVDPTAPIYLGACVDTETDAQAPLDLSGDDGATGTSTQGTCAVVGDDEDGVTFTSALVACNGATADVVASAPGVLDAWIDFDGDGTFAQAGERIANGMAVVAGVNNLGFTVPCAVAPGTQASRFRYSSTGVASFDGPSMDGEVEDHPVVLVGSDFGDAPDSYGTSDGAGGPSHGVDPAGSDFFLGACADTETDAATPLFGAGDDGATGTSTAGTCAVTGDDEDGVSFDTMLIACQSTDLTLTASAVGVLDAWIDFDGDGSFAQPGERVFSGEALAAGANARSIAVPCDAAVGNTYARFRFSSAGVASSGGAVLDGEVEDYAVLLKGSDYGDAPDTYGTLGTSGGPLHGVDPGAPLLLGACVDTESDAQAPLDATGDDLDASGDVVGTCVGGDDEDGVSFDTMVIACQQSQLTVTTSATGVLDGWVDFDGDGTFAQPGERVFNGQAVTAGANALNVDVPCDAAVGNTYARFRLSSTGVAGPGGPAMDGEVEDYSLLLKGSDLGDAPDSYGTTVASGGPIHGVDPTTILALGACVDTEADAQAPLDASGDDGSVGVSTTGTCAVAGDDEDGISFDTSVTACQSASITVTTTAAGVLDAWIDFGGEGTFVEAGDRIFSGQALAAGPNALVFPVPCDATLGATYARFRLSSAGVAGSGGPSMDGEIEDYPLVVFGSDLGDAPDSYGTTVGSGGAIHGVDPTAGFHLGACVDTEIDAQVPLDASGDDVSAGTSTTGTCAVAGDDEDGVSFDTALVACRDADVTVTASLAGVLDAWVDFGGDGVFDAGDQVFTGQALAAGANALTFNVPCDAAPGTTYSRFRLSAAGSPNATGTVTTGEVEDYEVSVRGVDFGDAPDSYATTFAAMGPSHAVTPGTTLLLGSCVDTEADGQPGGNATDDDDTVGSSVVGTCSGNDDEDGVTFDTLITACKPATLTVTTLAGGRLDAWIDFGADGGFGDAEDQIFTSEVLVAGANELEIMVPCTAVAGATFARFRLSSAGGLGFDGPADDGEVEDYAVASDEADLGDAPDSYLTLFDSGGPLHGLDPARDLYLGACVDSETDGQPSVGADGDDTGAGASDLGTCAGNDDEDGVTFDTAVIACQQADFTIVASEAGRLDAWIDLDGDGTFSGVDDQIFADVALLAGSNPLSIQVPCDATPGTSYARFRVSSVGGLGFGGTTPDGEVEDYRIEVLGSDLGDAPDGYQTTFGVGGPHHGVDPSTPLHLGVCVDTEVDGQPAVGADGDDLGAGVSAVGTCVDADDEDGVVFDTDVNVCLQADVTVTVSAAGFLDAWLDLDGDGTFVGPADQIFAGQPLVAGANPLSFTVPCDAIPGDSYARFRLSSVGGLGFAGPSTDGEVEDYPVLVQGFDFGDAPEPTYPTFLGSDGARHIVLPTDNPTLGAEADIEIEGLASPDHLGDDQDQVDDEDGVSFSGLYIPNAPAQITVETGAVGGVLNAWIDYDQDGEWDEAGEQIAIDLALGAGVEQTLDLVVEALATVGPTCARFRFSSDTGLAPTGMASDGEVEDYQLIITEENALIGLSKVILDVRRVDPEGSYDVTFLMRLENFGNIRIGELQVVSDLATAFAESGGYSVVLVDSAELTLNPAFDGEVDANLLTGADALDPGEMGEILLSVNVFPNGNPGPYFCSATASGRSDADTDVMDVSQDGDDPDDNDNGDPTDDEDPTVVIFDLPPIDIPTLGEIGLMALILVLALLGVRRLRVG